MTYAQYAALVDGHNAMNSKRGRRRGAGVVHATHGDIAALKQVSVGNG